MKKYKTMRIQLKMQE